jgi:hypothetical protein
MPRKSSEASQVVTLDERGALLDAFAQLVAERYGYAVARRIKQAEMSVATEALRKEATALRSRVAESIESLIKEPTTETAATITEARASLEAKRKEISEASKPYREAMSPLNKGVRFFDNVIIPDSLKQLGYPIQPIFNLSDHVKEKMELAKKAKKVKAVVPA